jgi:hypothetical protein
MTAAPPNAAPTDATAIEAPLRLRLREALPVVLVALLWRLSCLMSYLSDPAAMTLRFDEASYHSLGMRLARGDLLLDAEPLVLSPLYSLFVGAIYAMKQDSVEAVLWVQALIGTGMVLGVYLLARRIASRGAASAAALIYAVTGPALFYEHFLLPDALTGAMLLGSLRAWFELRRKGRRRDAAGLGLWLGLAILARPNALLLLPLVAWSEGRAGDAQARSRAGIAVALALLVMAPVTARNIVHGGSFTLVTASAPLHFYVGNSHEADGTFRVPEEWVGSSPGLLDQLEAADKAAEERMGRDSSVDETNLYWIGQTLSDIADRPFRWLGTQASKAGNLVRGREETDVRAYAFERRYVPLLGSPFVPNGSVLIVFGLLGLGIAVRRRHPDRFALVAVGLVLPLVTAMVFYVVGRYRLPWYPALACAAALGFDAWMQAVRAGSYRRAVAAAVGAGTLLVLTNLRLAPGDERPNHFLRGRELYDAYEPRRASEHFLEAATHPRLRDQALQNAAVAMMEGGLLDASDATLSELIDERAARGDTEGASRAWRLRNSLRTFRTPDPGQEPNDDAESEIASPAADAGLEPAEGSAGPTPYDTDSGQTDAAPQRDEPQEP